MHSTLVIWTDHRPLDARSIIAKLRRREDPSAQELAWFAQGLADQSVSSAQAGAFAMGVCLSGLSNAGRVSLTLSMRDSGQVLDWSGLNKPVLDKHSTGGVGDCVSLLLAPALAACDVAVPMISGRGLGHTGGTLDKLESIPGLSTKLDEAQFRRVVERTGAAIVGASANIAPADKRLYAIRDVTATVQSLDLITASILSKKLAAGLDGLVLDVKTGSGAIMKDETEAHALAEALVQTANAAGCKTSAILTDMSQPLVPAMGNALEVAEIARLLTDAKRAPVLDVALALGGVLLADADVRANAQAGADLLWEKIRSGAAAERFSDMITAQGGPLGFMDSPGRYLPEATVIREVKAKEPGFVTALNGEALGLAVVAMGGGRQVEDDVIDPAVGFSDIVTLGAKLAKSDVLAVVHASHPDRADQAEAALHHAIEIGSAPPILPDLIKAKVA